MANPDNLSTLLQRASLDDHTQVLQAAKAALKSNKNDSSARVAQAVALLNLDRFQDAVHVFNDANDSLKQAAPLEYAYALYKTSALADADAALQKVRDMNIGLRHMEAQIAYKREEFARSAEIYHDLYKEEAIEQSDESDLRINRGAVDAQLSWSRQTHYTSQAEPSREDLEQFETAFNAGCGCLARGDLKTAEILLSRSRELCNAAEELSEEEKRAETLSIETQLICVMCHQKKYEEAAKVASSVRQGTISDLDTRQIASANLLAARRGPTNPYLAQKALDAGANTSLNDQLFQFQRSILSRNAMAIDLQTHKFARVEKAASENAWAGVYAAAAYARDQTGQAAIKALLPLLDGRPSDLGLLMTVVQLYVMTNNHQTATTLLETFLTRLERSTAATDQDSRFSPGLTGLAVSLYAIQNRTTSAKGELVKAARHWRRKSKTSEVAPSLLQAVGAALLENPSDDDEKLAGELFKEAFDRTPNEAAAAGLLAFAGSISHVDDTIQQRLPPISRLIEGIDAEALDAAGVARLEKQVTDQAGPKRPPDADAKSHKAKKMRKSRIPKDYEPNRTPDPERWLPLRDRSNWRPKGKKKGKSAQGMSTQGGLASEDARPSTPQQTVLKPKKKKGKGGK